jgi:hypothetical protein
MEAYRKKAKDAYGEKYESRVGPFRSLITQQMRRKPTLSEEDAAREMIGILTGAGKCTNHHKACIFAAAMDVKDIRNG